MQETRSNARAARVRNERGCTRVRAIFDEIFVISTRRLPVKNLREKNVHETPRAHALERRLPARQ